MTMFLFPGLAHGLAPFYDAHPAGANMNSSSVGGVCPSSPNPDCTFQDLLTTAAVPMDSALQNLGGGTGYAITAITMYVGKESAGPNVTSTTIDFRVVASDGKTLRADLGQVSFDPRPCNFAVSGSVPSSPYCVVSVTSAGNSYALQLNDIVGAICITNCGTVNIDPWYKSATTPAGWQSYDGGAQSTAATPYQTLTGTLSPCPFSKSNTINQNAGCGLSTGSVLFGPLFIAFAGMTAALLTVNMGKDRSGASAYLRRMAPLVVLVGAMFLVAWMALRSVS